jgi:hypothetical protein
MARMWRGVALGKLIGSAMTPAMFRFRLGILGMSICRFADITGVDYGTATAWGSTQPEAQGFPKWVGVMISAWEGGGVPKRA